MLKYEDADVVLSAALKVSAVLMWQDLGVEVSCWMLQGRLKEVFSGNRVCAFTRKFLVKNTRFN